MFFVAGYMVLSQRNNIYAALLRARHAVSRFA
jgi:hypothetical protein